MKIVEVHIVVVYVEWWYIFGGGRVVEKVLIGKFPGSICTLLLDERRQLLEHVQNRGIFF